MSESTRAACACAAAVPEDSIVTRGRMPLAAVMALIESSEAERCESTAAASSCALMEVRPPPRLHDEPRDGARLGDGHAVVGVASVSSSEVTCSIASAEPVPTSTTRPEAMASWVEGELKAGVESAGCLLLDARRARRE